MAGASPEKIERELVIPIEGEVATLDDVHDIESQVRSDIANIKVSFNHGTNMKFAILKLQQKMSALEQRLPEGTRISVDKFDTADLANFLMQLSIRGDAPLEELREVAERQVRRRSQAPGFPGIDWLNIDAAGLRFSSAVSRNDVIADPSCH